ncbi:hypothetical protein ACUXCC_005600 [Cytobacillus horneckiae]|uniref:hypothetical protein n=1 Tax=Cytobacillus horneckiae TaxID=549687 RepID=UPI0019CFB7BE|nr:hypothetical protein [Cytobacillus horneckiae]MBN6890074.1 hypothetical protein [Cytobacillus horneckiae]
MDYHDFVGDKVKVIDKDQDEFVGVIISYEVGLEEDLDHDSIGIQVGKGYCISIPIPDIRTFEVLEQ